jgi:hypothetical protein
MKNESKIPQHTESEAIVAALRDADAPGTDLPAPVPLPVDVAAGLPLPGTTKDPSKG